jgi:hypothetical protein
MVALQLILYENMWARMAWLRGILKPPKNRKLQNRELDRQKYMM